MPSPLPLPPGANTVAGMGDYLTIGQEFFEHFVKYGGLQPHHRVLDVGCAIGRMARPLTEYLDRRGSYEGFDIVGTSIDWCRANITPHFPNFRFRRARIMNAMYGQKFAWFRGSDYVFPFRSGSFDFVFLTSVFTHLRPAEVANYLREISRVLKVGGRCFATYFLQTPETRALGQVRRGSLNFVHRCDGYWIDNPNEIHEAAICFDEPDVLKQYERWGFALNGPIRRGSWSGIKDHVSYQDIVVAEKVRDVPWLRTAATARTAWAWSRFGARAARAVARRSGRAARAVARRGARLCGLRSSALVHTVGRRAA